MSNEQLKVMEVEGLTKTFGTFTAVDDLSFSVTKGEIFGFLGANGAGKTTAMKMLTGILESSGGRAIVAGCDIDKQRKELKYRIGYMSQKFSLYQDLTVRENIRFFGGIYGLSNQEIALGIERIATRLALGNILDTIVGSIPLGWKQKIAFYIAIIHKPQVVFLDEPTSGVDPVTRRQFWDLIYEAAESGITPFVTTHYMDEAEYCDRISMMVQGKMAALGTLEQLLTTYGVSTMDEVFLALARGQ